MRIPAHPGKVLSEELSVRIHFVGTHKQYDSIDTQTI